MKRGTLDRWVRALQSGKYDQGKGNLRKHKLGETPQHCCLGVLCEITPGIELDDIQLWYETKTGKRLDPTGGWGDGKNGVAGLNYYIRRKLSEWNDDGYDFALISEWLDQYLMHTQTFTDYARIVSYMDNTMQQLRLERS